MPRWHGWPACRPARLPTLLSTKEHKKLLQEAPFKGNECADNISEPLSSHEGHQERDSCMG